MEKNKNLYNRPNSLSRNPQQRRWRRASIRNHSAGYHDYKSQRVIQIQICQKVMDNKMKKKNKRIWKEIIPTTKLSCETRRFACPPRYCKKILKRKEIIKGEMKNFWECDYRLYIRENEREMEEIKWEIKFWF